MAKIIAVAENYAFGPIAKLLTITKRLKELGNEITFIGFGSAYQLGLREKFDKIIKVDTNAKDFPTLMENEFKLNDLVLSSMDRSSVLLAQKLNIPVIWLDILFWWYDEIPDYLLKVDCYIKQDTLYDEDNHIRYAHKIKNLHSVGPMIDLNSEKVVRKRRQTVVAFGGMEADGVYKIGIDSNYPYILTEILVNQVDFSNFERALFTGNERIIKELNKRYGSNKFIFETLPHVKFIAELASSKLAIIVPGLETPLESFKNSVPTIFLPPSNSSQYMQLDNFSREGIALMSIHLADYYPRLEYMSKSLEERMKIFLDQLHIFETDKASHSDIAKRINNFIRNDKLHIKQITAQNKFMSSLKPNGTKLCIEIISKFIQQKGL